MIFKRKKSTHSATLLGDRPDGKISSKAETLYIGIMCFAAACLSFITLEVGTRFSLGQSVAKSATFHAIFRRNYSMKIKIMITNVVMGLITTIMLALGDLYRIPYLHMPWLINTMRGMLFHEGPALFGLTNVWLPNAGVSTGAFMFITFLLFVEELCLWFDVFGSLKSCWTEYTNRKTELSTDDNRKTCLTDEKVPKQTATESRLVNDRNFESIVKPTSILVGAASTFSNTRLRPTLNSSNIKHDASEKTNF
ncbi:uncharacterized protein [Venturia canescens]|uniref:uncharacterized protein n=1 Tax=Venturia canescens TaxID=32260 RepID=UPI001C9BCF8C|nr:uncharacterized protein LOC122413651 [Venturia canescens]